MRTRNMVLAAASVAALLVVTAPAGAQQYTDDVYYGGYGNAPEEVIVHPPYRGPERSAIGAPIVDASLTRAVRFDDLDLANPWGARTLRHRISQTARVLCDRLDVMYPVSASNSGGYWSDRQHCYDRAVGEAMEQADAAIHSAREQHYR